jgi:hypothetical protein
MHLVVFLLVPMMGVFLGRIYNTCKPWSTLFISQLATSAATITTQSNTNINSNNINLVTDGEKTATQQEQQQFSFKNWFRIPQQSEAVFRDLVKSMVVGDYKVWLLLESKRLILIGVVVATFIAASLTVFRLSPITAFSRSVVVC